MGSKATVERVAARNQADEVFSLAYDALDDLSFAMYPHFWRCLLNHVLGEVPREHHPTVEVGPDAALTPAESHKFELSRMPCGKYESELIGDVPIGYLLWLDDQYDLRREVRRYLKSARGQARQEEPNGE